MKFGASTFIWVSPFSNDTLDLFQKAKDMGYDILEICIEDPDTIDTDRIVKAAADTGMQVIICGAFGPERDVSATDAKTRAQGVAYIKTCIDIAVKVGSDLVSGPMFSATGKTNLLSETERASQWHRAVYHLKEASAYAKEKGVKLAIEPLNRFETDFINTVEQGLELVARIGMDNVGLLIDTFHMNIEEKNIGEAIRLAGDKVFNFHSCASDRGTPGKDHINWQEVKDALSDIHYQGPVVIEAFNSNITEIAKAVSLWRPLADSPDELAGEGVSYLKGVFG
ncbi:MAG: sugar phosphate isomerase/epimerase [Turicibacter sp.]|nr:sugar phosphate isomerase/epimerase [Turicibacter sp.]